jgi:O-antigen/teichoic acid export membrane protein
MGTANRVAKNTLILYARMGITMFISLYSTRLILAALGAEDFGIFNVVGGAVSMLTFLNNAMAGATQRFMSYAQGEGDEERQKKIFNASVILHLIVGALIVVIMQGVGYFFFNGILNISPNRIEVAKLIYHFLVISTFVRVISVPYDAVINARENMLFVASIGNIRGHCKISHCPICYLHQLRPTGQLWVFNGRFSCFVTTYYPFLLP